MSPEPAPPPRQRQEGEPPAEPNPGNQAQPRESAPSERYGPILIARHVKDDGRALLLYTHRPAESG